MIKLELENESKNVINIDDDVNYQLISATGFTSPSAEIFRSKSPNKKGSKYNGSTLNERYITLVIKILGDVEVNRNKLYAWIDSEQYVKINYQNKLKNVYCEGYIEESDIPMFDDNETIAVNLVCPDPYWKDLESIYTDISTLVSEFTFPFAIDKEGIPFSTILSDNQANVFNAGNETGIMIQAIFSGNVTGLKIFNGNDISQYIKFKNSLTFNEGDLLDINTDSSPKTITRIKADGTKENILKYVDGRPFWFTLKKGNNVFGYECNDETLVDLKIMFNNKYLGV
jgi:hypothetical protein